MTIKELPKEMIPIKLAAKEKIKALKNIKIITITGVSLFFLSLLFNTFSGIGAAVISILGISIMIWYLHISQKEIKQLQNKYTIK